MNSMTDLALGGLNIFQYCLVFLLRWFLERLMNIKLRIIPMLNGIFPENLFTFNVIDTKELKCPISGIAPLRLLLESFKWRMLSRLISGPICPWNWFELRISSSSFLWSHIQFGISPCKLLAHKSCSCNSVSPKSCSSTIPVKEEFLGDRIFSLFILNVWGTVGYFNDAN